MNTPVRSIEVPITFNELRLLLSIGISELSEYIANSLIGEASDINDLHTSRGELTEDELSLVSTTTAKVAYLFHQFNCKKYFNITTQGQKLYLVAR